MAKKAKKKKVSKKEIVGLKRKITQVVLIKVLMGDGRDVIVDELIEDGLFADDERDQAAIEFVNDCCYYLPDEKTMASLLEFNMDDESDVADFLDKLYEDYSKKMEKYFDYNSKNLKKSPEDYKKSLRKKIEGNWDLPEDLLENLLKYEFEFDFKVEGEDGK